MKKKIQAEGTSSSLGESIEKLSRAIEGLNSIKQQYAGNRYCNIIPWIKDSFHNHLFSIYPSL